MKFLEKIGFLLFIIGVIGLIHYYPWSINNKWFWISILSTAMGVALCWDIMKGNIRRASKKK